MESQLEELKRDNKKLVLACSRHVQRFNEEREATIEFMKSITKLISSKNEKELGKFTYVVTKHTLDIISRGGNEYYSLK